MKDGSEPRRFSSFALNTGRRRHEQGTLLTAPRLDLRLVGDGDHRYRAQRAAFSARSSTETGTSPLPYGTVYNLSNLGDQVTGGGTTTGFENVIMLGATPVTLTGNASANTLTGNDGDDTLDGLGSKRRSENPSLKQPSWSVAPE